MVGADVELPVFELDEAMDGTTVLFFEMNNLPSLSWMKPWLELMWSSQFVSLMKPCLELMLFELNYFPSLSLIKPWLELMWSS
jgi:hypothetical protein